VVNETSMKLAACTSSR